jgi:hypothetical protein
MKMAELTKIHNPDKVAVKMPPNISRAWLVDFLQKVGGTVIEEGEIMSQKQKNHIHQRSETKHDISVSTIVVCVTRDVDQIMESVSGQEGRILQRPNPTFSFYQSGDFFWIGEQGNSIPFKIINGLKYIHFLLRYPQEKIKPVTVYNLGKTLKTGNMVAVDVQPSIEKKLYDFSKDKKQRAAIRNMIKELEIAIDNPSINPLEKIEKKDMIEKLRGALKEIPIRTPKSESEKVRITVQRNIQRALKKIHEKLPDLEKYLNKSTIKTGDWCSYSPIPRDPVEWKLFRK